jgi:hypothetical protein
MLLLSNVRIYKLHDRRGDGDFSEDCQIKCSVS